jgi:hypothetical protein
MVLATAVDDNRPEALNIAKSPGFAIISKAF